MQIVYIDQTGQLGGGELSLLDWLSCRPENAKVFLFDDGPFRHSLEELGIPVDVLPLSTVRQIRRESNLLQVALQIPALLSLRRRLAQATQQSNLVYANSQKAFFLAAMTKRPGRVLIWHLRDILTKEHFSPVLRRAAALMGNWFASVILVNSQASADALVAAGGRREKIRIAPDGVDPAPFDQLDPESIRQQRNEINPENAFAVGLFGRLSPWKGQHILLEAVASLAGVHVFLVGDALFGESPYAQQLRDRANAADLRGRVHFLGFRKDVPQLMKCMDVIVHASTAAEPLGRVIIEGMLARKPVIATRAGGATEIVVEGDSGILVTPGSVAEMAVAITLLHSDQALRAELSRKGRLRAETAFSLELMVERIDAVLAEVSTSKVERKHA